MAIKKIRMRPESTNDYADVLHPETSIHNIVGKGVLTTATGTNTYIASVDNFPLLVSGYEVAIKFTNANSGNSTLNINGLGAKPIIKAGGGNPNIKAEGIYNLVYNGTSFQLLGEGGEYGNALANQVLSGRTFGTEGGVVIGTMPNRGTVTNTITTQGGSYTIPTGYHSGSGKVTANLSFLYTTMWKDRVISFGTTDEIYSVAYGNGMWVAVGGSGKLATSTNGITWTQRTSNFNDGDRDEIYSVAYGNGMWVVVGADDNPATRETKIATSTNGITWTRRDVSNFNKLNGVSYDNGMWVAVGYRGELLTSTNGTTWTKRTSSFGTTDEIYSVAYGNGMWVVVGGSGKLATSTNGINWTQRTIDFAGMDINSVAYGNGMWVAVGYRGKLATSTNGITWVNRDSKMGYKGSNSVISDINSLTYGDGFWIGVGEDNNSIVSSDARNWEGRQCGERTTIYKNTFNGIAYNNKMFIAVGESGILSTFS